MDGARELLKIAAEYVHATNSVKLAEGMGGSPSDDLDEIAGRWEAALDGYLTSATRG